MHRDQERLQRALGSAAIPAQRDHREARSDTRARSPSWRDRATRPARSHRPARSAAGSGTPRSMSASSRYADNRRPESADQQHRPQPSGQRLEHEPPGRPLDRRMAERRLEVVPPAQRTPPRRESRLPEQRDHRAPELLRCARSCRPAVRRPPRRQHQRYGDRLPIGPSQYHRSPTDAEETWPHAEEDGQRDQRRPGDQLDATEIDSERGRRVLGRVTPAEVVTNWRKYAAVRTVPSPAITMNTK